MASKENCQPGSSSNTKRTRKSCMIPLESGQRCVASAMSKVIKNMVSKQLQQRCKDLLEVEDITDIEARIYYVLQQIDFEREEEQKFKEKAIKRRGN